MFVYSARAKVRPSHVLNVPRAVYFRRHRFIAFTKGIPFPLAYI